MKNYKKAKNAEVYITVSENEITGLDV